MKLLWVLIILPHTYYPVQITGFVNLTAGSDPTVSLDPTIGLDVGEEPVEPEPPTVKFEFTAPNDMDVEVRALLGVRCHHAVMAHRS